MQSVFFRKRKKILHKTKMTKFAIIGKTNLYLHKVMFMAKFGLHFCSVVLLFFALTLPAQEVSVKALEVKPNPDSTILLIADNFNEPALLPLQDSLLYAQILNAIAAANAYQLSEYFDVAVNLILPQNEGAYSKKQATQLLKYFFEKNPVKEFLLEYEDKTDKDLTYLIGFYTTTDNRVFRVFILIKKLNDTELIRQIQFEEK